MDIPIEIYGYCDIIPIALVIIALILYYYVRIWKNICENSIQTHNALLEAIYRSDIFTAIKLTALNPKIINERHPVNGYTAFMRACILNRTRIVICMLQNGADLSLKSPKSETPFYLAIFHLLSNTSCNNASCIRALYYAGCDINTPNEMGTTPLHLAIIFDHTNLVKWLLKKGASISLYPDPQGLARSLGHFEIAMLFNNYSIAANEKSI